MLDAEERRGTRSPPRGSSGSPAPTRRCRPKMNAAATGPKGLSGTSAIAAGLAEAHPGYGGSGDSQHRVECGGDAHVPPFRGRLGWLSKRRTYRGSGTCASFVRAEGVTGQTEGAAQVKDRGLNTRIRDPQEPEESAKWLGFRPGGPSQTRSSNTRVRRSVNRKRGRTALAAEPDRPVRLRQASPPREPARSRRPSPDRRNATGAGPPTA